jgi:peptidoglycan hydrolase CwlO-like protein
MTTLQIMLWVLSAIGTVFSTLTTIVIFKRIARLQKRAVRADADINTLHKNQEVLMSSLVNLNKQIKHNEKTGKEIKRQVKVRFSGERSGREGSGPV